MARLIFLCASTIESARILLHSSTPEFSTGLANSSGELGHNLMDHCMGGGAKGIIPGNEDRTTLGRPPQRHLCASLPQRKEEAPDFLRGYGFQGDAGREGWERGADMPGFGVDFKHALRRPGPWEIVFRRIWRVPSPSRKFR